jgi:hypothetical protein
MWVIVLAAMAVPATSSAAILVDDYGNALGTYPLTVTTSGGFTSMLETALAGVLGNRRFVTLNANAMAIPGLDKIELSINLAGSGVLDLTTTIGTTTGAAQVGYGSWASGPALNLDLSGFAGVELSISAFDPPVSSPTTPMTVALEVDDPAPGFPLTATPPVPVLTPGAQTVLIPFAGLVGVDLHHVDGFNVIITAPAGTDLRITSLSIVPEPAAGAVLLFWACTSCAARRRRPH